MLSVVVAVSVTLAITMLAPGRPRLPAARRDASHRSVPVLLLAAPAMAATAVLHGRRLALGVIVLLVFAAARRLVARQRAARAAEVTAGRVMEFCESLAAELAAGRAPQRVLERSVEEFREFSTVATAARLGSDVPASLRGLSSRPGCADLRLVAAAWHVAHRSGSGMAVALEQMGRTIRERRRTSRLVGAELAAAHATARMMAALPLVFVLAGPGLGADPMGFLTGTTGGLACLAAGLALCYAGLAWLQRIAESVTGR